MDDTTPEPAPPAHPGFAAHFTDAVYDPDLPENDDTLPFGTDDASDLFAEWVSRSATLVADPRLDTVLGFSARELARAAADGDDESGDQLVAAAFVLMRATGTIGGADQQLVLRVLRGLVDGGSDETYAILLDDLETFVPDDGPNASR